MRRTTGGESARSGSRPDSTVPVEWAKGFGPERSASRRLGERLGQLLGRGAVALEDVSQVRHLVVGVDLLGRLRTRVPQDVLDLRELRAAIEHDARLCVSEVMGRRLDADRSGVA